MLGEASESVIPEDAKRLSGIQKNLDLLDTGSRLRLVRYDDYLHFSTILTVAINWRIIMAKPIVLEIFSDYV